MGDVSIPSVKGIVQENAFSLHPHLNLPQSPVSGNLASWCQTKPITRTLVEIQTALLPKTTMRAIDPVMSPIARFRSRIFAVMAVIMVMIVSF
jgi:hypothetical protein